MADALTTELMNEYGSALDASTLLAILSDFELTDASQLAAAREILDELKKCAKEEEDGGFDPSGSSGAETLLYNGDGNARGDNDSASGKGWASSTDSMTYSMSSLDIDGVLEIDRNREDATYGTQLESSDQEAKESTLIEMFPGLKPFDVRWTLEKYNWDINNAINDLMTQSFMEENGNRQRGIEAFSEIDLPSQARKGKGKKKRTRAFDDLSSPISPDSLAGSIWDTGKQDVEFITTRTGKPLKDITSLYHKNGASIRATIIAVLETQITEGSECHDPLIQSRAIDLGHEFPSVPSRLLKPLIQISHPSTANAHELAKALVSHPTSNKPIIQIEFRHAPLELDPTPLKSKSSNSINSGLTLGAASQIVAKSTKEREIAFTQARAAYRKGKSDPLMGGAAAYYSEIGRAADSRLKSAQSAAADALVAGQSSRTQLDLHGVNVQDAKRITKERVTTWWHELGESRLNGRGVITVEYRIITGVGYHSEGGKSKLAPALLKMLMSDGWKVQVGTGVLIVTGIAKRK